MICLRCGYCCKNLWVPIVNDVTKGPVDENLIVHEGHGIACKHLLGKEPGKYSCLIHNETWYEETPCSSHTQIERNPKSHCRMGVYVLK